MIKGRLDCSGTLYWWQMIHAARLESLRWIGVY